MNNKYLILFTLVISLFAISNVNATSTISCSYTNTGSVNVFLNYDSTASTTMTVTQGDVITLAAAAMSHNGPLWYEDLQIVSNSILFHETNPGTDNSGIYTYSKSYDLNTQSLAPGTYTLKFMAYSQYDCSYDSATLTLTVKDKPDTTAPAVKITYPSNGATYTSNITQMTFTATDDHLSYCTYKLNNNVPVTISNPINGANTVTGISSTQGSNTWSVTCYDTSNNHATDSVTFTVTNPADTTKPVVKIQYPLDQATYNHNVTNANFTVNEANLASCWYNLNGVVKSLSSCSAASINNIYNLASKEGFNDLAVYAKDQAGNIGYDEVTYTVQLPDTTKPTVHITYPSNGATYSSQITHLSFNAYDDHLASCEYKLNSGSWNYLVGASNGANVVTGITSVTGSNTWSVRCTDQAGNIAYDSVTFKVVIPDTTAPKVHISYPTNGATYAQNITHLTFTATDDHLSYCTYKLNNGPTKTVQGLINGVNTITGISSTQGSNTWSVTCYDTSNNHATDSVTFTVKNPADTTKPKVKIFYPEDGVTYDHNVTKANFTVNESNLKSCWYNLNGVVKTLSSCSTTSINNIYNLASAEGFNDLAVYAKDKAGNIGYDEVTYWVQLSTPTSNLTITPINPTQGEVVNPSIVFQAETNKDANVTYSLDGNANLTMTKVSNFLFDSAQRTLAVGNHSVLFCADDGTKTVCALVDFQVKDNTKPTNNETCTTNCPCDKEPRETPASDPTPVKKVNKAPAEEDNTPLVINFTNPQTFWEKLWSWVNSLFN
jgi:ureidoglycolate hydrolase